MSAAVQVITGLALLIGGVEGLRASARLTNNDRPLHYTLAVVLVSLAVLTVGGALLVITAGIA